MLATTLSDKSVGVLLRVRPPAHLLAARVPLLRRGVDCHRRS
jgi:hypothetical protein